MRDVVPDLARPSLAATRWAAERPDDLAVAHGSTRLTWRELDARVDLAAERLTEHGAVSAGDRVVVVASPSADAVVVLHALARLGAVAAPLGTRLTPAELEVAVGIVRPTLVVHDETAAGRVGALGVRTMRLDTLVGAGARPARPRRSGRSSVAVDPSAPAIAVLTSGTTGRPKVALLSHAALEASIRSWTDFLPAASGWLLCLGLAHVAGLGVVWRAAAAGLPLVVLPEFDAAAVLTALAVSPAPSHVSLVPTQLARLLDIAGDRAAPDSIRAVLLGGGVIPPALVTRAIAAGWPVVPTYGMTETASGSTALPSDEAGTHAETAGRPLPGVELRIVDPGPDGVGDVLVRTASRFTAYLDDPAATRRAVTDDGWLRTGDLGRLDPDGRLIVVDRRTDLVVSGGENVAPAEVEAVLGTHPAIADAGVVGRPDATWGAVPIAAVVFRAGLAGMDAPADEELRAFCRERLAPYKVPAAFIPVASLPRTSSGKLQRARLREDLRREGLL